MAWYDRYAAELALAYEALDPARVHAWLLDLLLPEPALVLDADAGTGRDAAWLAVTHRLGLAFDVVLLSGLWQHVAPGNHARAVRERLGLLRPGGVLALTLRLRPADSGRRRTTELATIKSTADYCVRHSRVASA